MSKPLSLSVTSCHSLGTRCNIVFYLVLRCGRRQLTAAYDGKRGKAHADNEAPPPHCSRTGWLVEAMEDSGWRRLRELPEDVSVAEGHDLPFLRVVQILRSTVAQLSKACLAKRVDNGSS